MSEPAVTIENASPRAIASIAVRLPVSRVPAVFGGYLDQVYALGKSGAIALDGQNIFVYRDTGTAGEADVEFGVGVKAPFAPIGAVRFTALPTGDVATATHWGSYATLGDTHHAILAWCRANGRVTTGTRWEVYGHMAGPNDRPRTDVCYQLRAR